jgi:hypothetical protein
MTGLLLNLLGPLVIGPLTFLAMQGIKGLNVTIDALPAVAKRIAVAVIAVGLTLLADVTGVDVACDVEAGVNCLTTLDKDALKGIIAAIVAFALHALKNVKKG